MQRLQKKEEISLSQVKEEPGLGFVKLTVSRLFEEVKTNVFEMAPLSWKFKDFQQE